MRSYKPDDTVYCATCGVALLYDRDEKRWVADWTPEEHPEVKRCIVKNRVVGEAKRYDHVPQGNFGRLLRAARKMRYGHGK